MDRSARPLTSRPRIMLAVAFALAAATAPARGNVPITELQGTYQGRDGGLYGGGRNVPPGGHARAAAAEAAKIRPLDRRGRPARNGKIALVSIGQSTTIAEFTAFRRAANRSPLKSRGVALVDGAQNAAISQTWAASAGPWNVVASRLRAAGLAPAQVQVLWVEMAHLRPWQYGPFPAHTRQYAAELGQILRGAKRRFPNLRIAYLSSRIYAGYAHPEAVSPEPFAYESAFGVRLAIDAQIQGDPGLNFDPMRGQVAAPLLLWGPYLWADGTTPRQDGLAWSRADFAADGVHPSASGQQKIADQLLRFFTTDPSSRPWFLSPASRP